MKKKLKAFTLVECIIALAVFAIAALTITQVYASIARMNKQNEYMQYSLAKQMQYIERETNSGKIEVPYNAEAEAIKGQMNMGDNNVFKIVGGIDVPGEEPNTYVYGVNMYVLYSRDILDRDSNSADFAYEDIDSNLRYKYLLPANPKASNSAANN
jgi:prepilin-type N-terminal cleavage/methylation domain-containing protein